MAKPMKCVVCGKTIGWAERFGPPSCRHHTVDQVLRALEKKEKEDQKNKAIKK